MKFESKDQEKPSFEAKGIETIRRDQCALTQKVLRNALITLFRHGLEAVKTYLQRQWIRILSGSLPVSDFILTGRVRSRYRGGKVGPVQAVLTKRLAEADPGHMVRHKERVSYVIVATPGTSFRLKDSVLTPMELLEQWDAFSIHTLYYIKKHVNAALQRCLGLVPHQVDVNKWFEACPKPRRRIHFWPVTRSGNSVMISSYFGSDTCSVCGRSSKARRASRATICDACLKDPMKAMLFVGSRLSEVQRRSLVVAEICSSCNHCHEDATTFAQVRTKTASSSVVALAAGIPEAVVTPLANCSCIDCPITYERHRLRESQLEASALDQAIGQTMV